MDISPQFAIFGDVPENQTTGHTRVSKRHLHSRIWQVQVGFHRS